ncbi:T9SS type A sorting domain-containing protein [Owenweeksia hongkongensis]|uniref:T9SS type A sorting domain-containing protein n=1 Tax=Owenweeksia hongkongensis TaxID=253245 RepID=UPI003A918F9E
MNQSLLSKSWLLPCLLVVSGSAFSQDLFVDSGDTLWVEPGGILTVEGSVTSNGTIYLNADATGYAQLLQVNNVGNTGQLDMEMYFTDMTTGWRQLGIPFTNQVQNLNIDGISFITSANDGGVAGRRNMYYWDATDAGAGEGIGWTEAAPTTTGSRSYTVFGDQNGVHDFTQTIRIGGTPSNGNQAFAVKNTYDIGQTGNANARGWNFIPNPYPSNVSVDKLFALGSFPTYEAIHVWDNVNGQYEALTSSGVTVYNTNATASGASHIQPFQGFWIKVDADGTFTLDNTVREPDSTATAFMSSRPYDLLNLSVTNTNDSTYDRMVVFFGPDATIGMDNGYDAYKIKSTRDVPTMYMEYQGLELSINHLPVAGYSIPVTVKTQQAQTLHTFSLDDNQLDPAWKVELEDLAGGKRIDLRKQDMTVKVDMNDNDKRFVLHLNQQGVALNAEQTLPEIVGWVNAEGQIGIRKIGMDNGTLKLYGLGGKCFATKRMESDQTVLSPRLASGVYLLQFTDDNLKSSSTKILVP